MNDYKYYAFISYKREDEEWAVWLQHELEYYHLPAVLNGREDLPKEFRPVFRDIDELKAGNLPNQIHEALASSANLIVICSPRSANSIWVNKEIKDFIEIGKSRGTNNLERVFPFIVDGTPHAKDESQECFPKALRDLPANQERIGGNVNEKSSNVNESGRDKAFIKIMAGMLPNVSMDMLWNRYERDKAEEERRKREERDRLLALQSRFVAEKAKEVMDEVFPYDKGKAACMALEVLPTDLVHPERPLVPEVELVLREAMFEYTTIAEIEKIERHAGIIGINEKFVAYYGFTGSVDINTHRYSDTIWIHEISTGKKLHEFKGIAYKGCLSSNGLIFAYSDADCLFGIRDALSGTCITPIDVKINYPLSHHTIAFSPDGSLLAIGEEDGQSQNNSIIGIWNTKSGKCVNVLKGPNCEITSLKFDQNNQRIVASMHKNSIMIWEISSGNNIFTIENQGNGYFKFADFITNTNSIVYIQCQSQSTMIDKLKTNVYFDTLYVYDINNKKQITKIDLADSHVGINGILFDNEYTIVDYGEGMDVYHSLNGNHIFHNYSTRSIVRQREMSFLALTNSEIIKFELSSLQETIFKAKEKYKEKALSEVEKKKYFITL